MMMWFAPVNSQAQARRQPAVRACACCPALRQAVFDLVRVVAAAMSKAAAKSLFVVLWMMAARRAFVLL